MLSRGAARDEEDGAGDAMASAVDAAKLLGIDVQQLAGDGTRTTGTGGSSDFRRDNSSRFMQWLTVATPRPACAEKRHSGQRWRRPDHLLAVALPQRAAA